MENVRRWIEYLIGRKIIFFALQYWKMCVCIACVLDKNEHFR